MRLSQRTLCCSFAVVGVGGPNRGKNRARHLTDAGRKWATQPSIVHENCGLYDNPQRDGDREVRRTASWYVSGVHSASKESPQCLHRVALRLRGNGAEMAVVVDQHEGEHGALVVEETGEQRDQRRDAAAKVGLAQANLDGFASNPLVGVEETRSCKAPPSTR